jgi:hypothetical protein
LLVSGLRALVARLEAAGVGVVEEAMEGYDRVYVSDPFGNRLELMDGGERGFAHSQRLMLQVWPWRHWSLVAQAFQQTLPLQT